MRNLAKVLLGSALGAGIGAAIAKVAGRGSASPSEHTLVSDDRPRESFKERLARAREAGEAARIAKEAELAAYFRRKVNDPDALPDRPKL
jgi:hypothetical protein